MYPSEEASRRSSPRRATGSRIDRDPGMFQLQFVRKAERRRGPPPKPSGSRSASRHQPVAAYRRVALARLARRQRPSSAITTIWSREGACPKSGDSLRSSRVAVRRTSTGGAHIRAPDPHPSDGLVSPYLQFRLPREEEMRWPCPNGSPRPSSSTRTRLFRAEHNGARRKGPLGWIISVPDTHQKNRARRPRQGARVKVLTCSTEDEANGVAAGLWMAASR